MTSRNTHEGHPRVETTAGSGARKVRKVRLAVWQVGLGMTRVPLFPAGYVVVWELNLGYTRYLWGEVN